MRIKESSSIDELFIQWKQDLMLANEETVRGLKTKEILDTVTILKDPFNCIISAQDDKYYKYAIKEILFYIKGSLKVEDAMKISAFWEKVQEHGKINSNYGYHVLHKFCPSAHNQFEWVKREFKNDKNSRKCVMNINSIEHKNGVEKDFPCTIAYHFLIRDNKLSLRSYMRSNDLIYGWRYDVVWESFLLILMWLSVRETYPLVDIGEVIHHASSLHLYEKDWVR